jgi:parvulin-like peptidyl-prolyl isomerase
MPKDFVDRQVAAQALSEAFLARSAGISITPAAVKAYYEANTAKFDKICLSGILVSSKATADSLKSQLAAGADFATLASQNSIDAQSKAQGGALGCFDPTSGQYQSVLSDVGSLKVGEVTDPLPSQSGSYVLLTVTKRTTTPFDGLATIIRRTMVASAATKASAAVSGLLHSAQVSVNPRFGTWKATDASAGLVPPPAPATASIPNAAANLPGGSAAASASSGSSSSSSSAQG